jgi:histidine triad (HIT) family protein
MTELTQEQMAQMSPEQAAAMQKEQCIFCQIISGKVASKKVYEDDRCLAILDINPANPGHVLVLPKEHYSIMPLMPEEEVGYLFRISKKISKAQIRALKVEGTNIFAANGAAAGQKAPHFMIHIIPRKENDGITVFKLPKNEIGNEDQEKLRQAIGQKVNEHFGITGGLPPAPEPESTEKQEEEKEEPEQAEEVQEIKPEEDKEEHKVFDIPPPEPDEEAFEKHQEEETKEPKKKLDLDSISGLFK